MQKINKLTRYVVFWRSGIIKAAKPFYVNGLFLYLLETWFSDSLYLLEASENLWFSV